MAGTTFLTPIAAVLNIPQRTLFGILTNNRAFLLLPYHIKGGRVQLFAALIDGGMANL
jgi:hypothetical protein